MALAAGDSGGAEVEGQQDDEADDPYARPTPPAIEASKRDATASAKRGGTLGASKPLTVQTIFTWSAVLRLFATVRSDAGDLISRHSETMRQVSGR